MAHLDEFHFEIFQLSLAVEGEVAFPSLSAQVRKTEKVECLGWFFVAVLAVFLSEAAELEPAGLLGMQFQAELGKACLQSRETASGLGFVLESDHKVIRTVAHASSL